jgi:hypothetical protein
MSSTEEEEETSNASSTSNDEVVEVTEVKDTNTEKQDKTTAQIKDWLRYKNQADMRRFLLNEINDGVDIKNLEQFADSLTNQLNAATSTPPQLQPRHSTKPLTPRQVHNALCTLNVNNIILYLFNNKMNLHSRNFQNNN